MKDRVQPSEFIHEGSDLTDSNCAIAVQGELQRTELPMGVASLGELGINRLGVLLFTLLIAACVFVGYQVFPFYYYFYEIQGLMDAQALKASEFTDEEIRRNLMEKIKKLEIPLEDPEDLKINRYDGKISIEFEYDEVLYIELGEDKTYDIHTFEFHPRAERPLPERRR